MKIKINEIESYQIKIPEEITDINELIFITERLNGVIKLISKNPVINNSENPESVKSVGRPKNHVPEPKSHVPEHFKTRQKRHKLDLKRDEVIPILKVYYTKSLPDSKRWQFFTEREINNNQMMNWVYRWKKNFNIKPQELGFKEFPYMMGKKK